VDSDGLVGATSRGDVERVVTGLTGPLDFAFRTYTIDPDPALPGRHRQHVRDPAATVIATQYRIGGSTSSGFSTT
jgi:hypothetical protein